MSRRGHVLVQVAVDDAYGEWASGVYRGGALLTTDILLAALTGGYRSWTGRDKFVAIPMTMLGRPVVPRMSDIETGGGPDGAHEEGQHHSLENSRQTGRVDHQPPRCA